MKVLPPFIGFPSPNVTLGVWHLFARVGSKFQHIAFMTIGWNRWHEPRGSFAVGCGYLGEYEDHEERRNPIVGYRYLEEDLQRWSEFRP